MVTQLPDSPVPLPRNRPAEEIKGRCAHLLLLSLDLVREQQERQGISHSTAVLPAFTAGEREKCPEEVRGHSSTTLQVMKSSAFLLRTSKQNTFKDETLKLKQPANYKWDIVQVSLGFSLGNVFLLETTPLSTG